jgi:hypothetical protein
MHACMSGGSRCMNRGPPPNGPWVEAISSRSMTRHLAARLTNPIPNPTSRHDRRANHHDPEESSWRRCSHYARISSAGSCPCAQIFLLTAFAFVYSERNLEAGVKPTSRLEKGLASPRRRATVGTTAGVTCSIANAAMSEALSMRRKCRLSIAYACECV